MDRHPFDSLELSGRIAEWEPDSRDEDASHIEQMHERWYSLTGRIRRGDASAAADFALEYSRGVRTLFRRRLGVIGLTGVVDEAIAGATEEIRRGWIREPRDLVHFLRAIVERQAPLSSPESRGVSGRARIKAKANVLEAKLSEFSPRERTALERYYLRGEPSETILDAIGMSLPEFESLKARLQRALAPGRRAAAGAE